MAAISGDQKQKLYMLAGFLGIFMLVGFFALRTHSSPEEGASMDAGPTTVAARAQQASAPVRLAKAPTAKAQAAKTPTAKATAKAPTAKNPASKAPAAKTPAAKAPSATSVKTAKAVPAKAPVIPAPQRMPIEQSRPDPFEPFYYPTPEPPPTPTPVPPPVQLPPPPPAVSLPGPRLASAPPNTVLIGLPRPHIAGYTPLPGPVWARTGTSLRAPQEGILIRSTNKRLSGVIIGDSVRALLEITIADAGGTGGGGGEGGTAAANTIVRTVQPGDEVDGIKILRIERVYEGGRQVTRMFVREGNEERFVDLRPSPNPPAAAGLNGSEGGSSSGSFGSPSSSGSPFGGIRPSQGGFPQGGFPRGGRPPID